MSDGPWRPLYPQSQRMEGKPGGGSVPGGEEGGQAPRRTQGTSYGSPGSVSIRATGAMEVGRERV